MTTAQKYRVGELRPSQVMFTYGIGAIADLPHLAAIIMGLEDWQRYSSPVLIEERLLEAVQKQLGKQVEELRSLPIAEEDNNANTIAGVPLAPFPTWMVCPKCDLLAPLSSGLFELHSPFNRPTETKYIHTNCPKTSQYGRKPPKVIPVRFLVACESGHLDDFPWLYFVHKGQTNCPGPLRLVEPTVSGAVTDILVKCDVCNAKRMLSDAFGNMGQQNMPTCRGRHPHLRRFDDCALQMKTMLLGASNSWFSLSLSALSLPASGSNQLAQIVDKEWVKLQITDSFDELKMLIKLSQTRGELQALIPYTVEDIWTAIAAKKEDSANRESDGDLKTPEWQALSIANPALNNEDWRLLVMMPPPDFQDYFEKIVLVEKLREVRALIGFTRIQSPGDFTDTGDVPSEFRPPISRHLPTWIPATEVRGEGIFIHFKENALQAWENQPQIQQHHHQVKEAHKNWLNKRNADLVDKIPCPDMRYLLIHSFAHALMRQLALECGYNAASLRERIYAQRATPDKMAQGGVLIYTSAPDSEGTLGGLVNLGKEKILNYHIHQALKQIEICASDPLCADHVPDHDKNSLHWSACHACLFSPETSCERGNKFLDRSLLIPTLSKENLHFFKLQNRDYV